LAWCYRCGKTWAEVQHFNLSFIHLLVRRTLISTTTQSPKPLAAINSDPTMKNRKLFMLAFVLAFASTSILCIACGHPLIFLPVSYKLIDFFVFGILIGSLCFGLVFINMPFVKFFLWLTKLKISLHAYYIISTLLILQILTLALGYLESYFTRGMQPTPFYYYGGVGNSLIYILTGNLTAIIVSYLYAQRQDNSKERYDQSLN